MFYRDARKTASLNSRKEVRTLTFVNTALKPAKQSRLVYPSVCMKEIVHWGTVNKQ